MMNTEGWIVNLSNGETIAESAPVPGEPSSWQRLLKRCRDEKISITRLMLWRNDVRYIALPVKGCEGYVHAYESTRSWFSNQTGLKQGIGSIVGDKVFMTWVTIDAQETLVYQDVRPLSAMLIHSTKA